jgi:O-antigen/teichoic acid export membrane protein
MNARRPPSPLHNLLTGTVAKYALLAINIGIGLWMMPFTIGHLGKSDYGLWMLVASMTAYFQLLDLGYGNGLVRQIAAADSVHDVDAVNQVVSTFVVIYAGIGAVALAVVGLLALTVLPRFPHLTPPQVAKRTARIQPGG